MADSASQRQHIDRAEQLSRAARLASGEETGQRALFFEGPEGIGKSSLLFEIHDRHRENGAYFVDLERTVREYDVLETLAIQARGQRVETPSYRTARDRFAEQAGSLNVEFTNVRARASAFQIIGQTEDRILRTAALSDALLDNLLADDRRPVFCLDGFERCGQPMRKWLGDSLLPNLLSRKDAGVFLVPGGAPADPPGLHLGAHHGAAAVRRRGRAGVDRGARRHRASREVSGDPSGVRRHPDVVGRVLHRPPRIRPGRAAATAGRRPERAQRP
ncbi:hypothetical protein ACFQ0T_36435 [Kitasatospora gansuensis]